MCLAVNGDRHQCANANELTVSIGGLTSAYVLSYRTFLASLQPSERALYRYPKIESMNSPEREKKADRGARKELMPSISWLEGFTHASGFRLLISHHPEYYDLIPSVDLVLCGHTHGAQARIKIGNRWIGAFAPGQSFFPHYCYGRYGNMIISAGLTNTT